MLLGEPSAALAAFLLSLVLPTPRTAPKTRTGSYPPAPSPCLSSLISGRPDAGFSHGALAGLKAVCKRPVGQVRLAQGPFPTLQLLLVPK